MTCNAEEHTSSQVPDNVFKHIYFVWHLIDLVLNEKKKYSHVRSRFLRVFLLTTYSQFLAC